MYQISEKQKKTLRGLGHKLKPVVIVADAGLTENVRNEIEQALNFHELIKISIRSGDRVTRDGLIDTICKDFQAQLVQRIGNIGLFFRRNTERPKVVLGSR
ncbi:MAG: YhbY family RNA-binding protein [Pseudomonadota bacterium]